MDLSIYSPHLYSLTSLPILNQVETQATSFNHFSGLQDIRPLDSQPSKKVPDPSSSEHASKPRQQENSEITQVIRQLKARDTEVKVHEQAHIAAGGAYVTSGPDYVYQTGPDGQQYAIGGEVGIDTAPVNGDPEVTLKKALVIQRAALAPAEPSSQDRNVAAQASQMAVQARQEISRSENNSTLTEQFDQANQSADTSDIADDGIIPLARSEFEARLAVQID